MNGRNPTLAEKIIIKTWHLNCDNYLVLKHTTKELHIKHRLNDMVKKIPLGGIE